MNPELELEALAQDEDGRIEETTRAERARQLIGNPLWQETFQMMEDGLMDRLMAADTGEVAMGYKNGLNMLRQIKQEFETCLETGKLANIQLEKIRERRGILSKIRNFGRAA
jgi:hypothetical protein